MEKEILTTEEAPLIYRLEKIPPAKKGLLIT